MENASKALIIAGGILIGLLILSLAVYLFTSFGASSAAIHKRIEEKQLAEFNAKFNVYEGREDITIYDIITLYNRAKENNDYYKSFSNYDDLYKIDIKLDNRVISDKKDINIGENSTVDEVKGELKDLFSCKSVKYHDRNHRVSEVIFVKNRN